MSKEQTSFVTMSSDVYVAQRQVPLFFSEVIGSSFGFQAKQSSLSPVRK
jgi:hypothetical protein